MTQPGTHSGPAGFIRASSRSRHPTTQSQRLQQRDCRLQTETADCRLQTVTETADCRDCRLQQTADRDCRLQQTADRDCRLQQTADSHRDCRLQRLQTAADCSSETADCSVTETALRHRDCSSETADCRQSQRLQTAASQRLHSVTETAAARLQTADRDCRLQRHRDCSSVTADCRQRLQRHRDCTPSQRLQQRDAMSMWYNTSVAGKQQQRTI